MTSKKLLILTILSFFLLGTSQAKSDPDKEFNFGETLMHHVLDSYEWELTHGVSFQLPRILISSEHGLDVFLNTDALRASGKYEVDSHGHAHLGAAGHGEAVHSDENHGPAVYDFSITKTVFQMILMCLVMIFLFVSIAKAYKKRKGEAPKGAQSLFEPIILFVRDEIAKPSLGDKANAFLPYLLTVFFFIWFCNMFGLTPLNSNITGNIAVTSALAIMSFLLIQFNGSKDYYKHLIKPDGVPGWMLPIVVIIEILGVFIKPLALTLRLFANIIGGHFMILSLVGLIFVLGKNGESPGLAWGTAPVAIIVPAVLMLLEFLVAILQAYIFTMLTAVFIGMARETHDHGPEGAH